MSRGPDNHFFDRPRGDRYPREVRSTLPIPVAMTLLALLALLTGACHQTFPGEALGSFDVVGHLEHNECGQSAVPAVDPMHFAVEIRDDRGQVVWRRAGQPIVNGMEQEGALVFHSLRPLPLFGRDLDTGRAGCTLAQREVVRVRLAEATAEDAGVADPSDAGGEAGLALEGENWMQLIPTEGSDCTPALAVVGGPFAALPCEVRYTLEGSAREPL